MVHAPLLIAWVLATLLSLPGDATAGESIAYWDFEAKSDVADWPAYGGTMTSVPDPVEGDRAAQFAIEGTGTKTGMVAAANAVHKIALQPGATYRFSGRALVNDPNVRLLRLEIRWSGAITGPDSQPSGELTPPAATFRHLSTPEALVPCDVVSAQLAVVLISRNSAIDAHAYLDDLRLELVAPPQPCPTPALPPPPTPSAVQSSVDAPSGVAVPSSSGELTNGGFEIAEGGLPMAWRNFGGALTQVAAPVRGGSFAGALSSASGSTKWAYQTVAVTPTAWYRLDAYVYLNDPRAEAALLRISWYTSADGSGRAVATVDSTSQLDEPQGRYRYLTTGPVQAPPGVRSAKVRVLLRPRSAASAVIYIDDVSFRPAAPGAVTSLGGSAGGSGGGGGGSSGASFGLANQGDMVPLTPLPTPVLVRSSLLQVEGDSLSGGGATWWPWAAAGGAAIAIAAAGWGAWWWRRRKTT